MDGRLGVVPFGLPGCLNRPKFMDFLRGCMLHEIVWPDDT